MLSKRFTMVAQLFLETGRTASQMPPPGAGDFSRHAKKSAATRVLVVDDEPLVRWSVSETLAGHGCEVVEAGNGKSALDAVSDRSRRIDVVFLDLRLPDCDDLQLLARMRRVSPMTPIILMTAHGTPEIAADAVRLGAIAVVDKPFEIDDLAPLVWKATRRQQPN
jgi:two-component system, NtrC family, response regulator AtoC